jgi:hypothetical protein
MAFARPQLMGRLINWVLGWRSDGRRHGAIWSKYDQARLKHLAEIGLPLTAIAADLERSQTAVSARARKLGITMTTPGKPPEKQSPAS